MNKVYFSLGSNMGNRYRNIHCAVKKLDDFIFDMRVAPIYESEPVDYLNQNNFLNTVVEGLVTLPPDELLRTIQGIEYSGGRDRSVNVNKGPRTIDIDIILFNSQFYELELDDGQKLIIPHESMHQRLFVLIPLLKLSPEAIDPRDNEPWQIKASKIFNQPVSLWM